jgi:hypothetical protein
MRIKPFTPPKSAHGIIGEIDLTDESATQPDAAAFTKFTFVPDVALKNIHIPILTPLVGTDVPGSPPEPVFDPAAQDDIQGNIIPGFNKDHQHFLFLRICEVKAAKAFLRELVPRISTMEDVIAFRRLYRAKRLLLGRHHTFLCSTWVNIAFSRHAIELLATRADADAFGDRSFQLGLAGRSSYLGDPTVPSHQGSPLKWKVGGPRNEADIVLIVASDHTGVLDDLVGLLKQRASAAGLELIFEQRGDTLSGDLRGHEHFGFKDGVSQPGVRGKLSSAPGDYITPRYISAGDARLVPCQARTTTGVAGAVPSRRTAAIDGKSNQRCCGGGELSEMGEAGIVPGRPPARTGRCRVLHLRVARRSASRPARGDVRGHAGWSMAQRRAHHADARRRQSGAWRRRLRQQSLRLRRQHAAVIAQSDSRLSGGHLPAGRG